MPRWGISVKVATKYGTASMQYLQTRGVTPAPLTVDERCRIVADLVRPNAQMPSRELVPLVRIIIFAYMPNVHDAELRARLTKAAVDALRACCDEPELNPYDLRRAIRRLAPAPCRA